jgi:hypothetical protein
VGRGTSGRQKGESEQVANSDKALHTHMKVGL